MLKIELGKTYVTLNGDWIKIVNRSCMTVDADYPFTGSNDIQYSDKGICGVLNWNLLMEVPEEQVTLRKVHELLTTLSGNFSMTELTQMQKQAGWVLDDIKAMMKQTYQ